LNLLRVFASPQLDSQKFSAIIRGASNDSRERSGSEIGLGVVRCSDEGNFFALDAVTGKPLWDIYLGSSLRSNPVTQAVTGGTTYFAFSLP